MRKSERTMSNSCCSNSSSAAGAEWGGGRGRGGVGAGTDHRQFQNKAGAADGGGRAGNPPVVVGQYAVNDRESQTAALAHFLGGEERLKNMRQHFRRHSRAVVLHQNLNKILAVLRG